MIFENNQINLEKSPEENIKIIKTFLDDLVERLNLQSETIENINNKIKEREEK